MAGSAGARIVARSIFQRSVARAGARRAVSRIGDMAQSITDYSKRLSGQLTRVRASNTPVADRLLTRFEMLENIEVMQAHASKLVRVIPSTELLLATPRQLALVKRLQTLTKELEYAVVKAESRLKIMTIDTREAAAGLDEVIALVKEVESLAWELESQVITASFVAPGVVASAMILNESEIAQARMEEARADYRVADAEVRQADERLAEAQNNLTRNGLLSLDDFGKVVALAEAEKTAEEAHEKFDIVETVYTKTRVEAKREADRMAAGMSTGEKVLTVVDIALTPPIPGYAEAETAVVDHVIIPLAKVVSPCATQMAEIEKAQQLQEKQAERSADWKTVNAFQDEDQLDQELSKKSYPYNGRIIPTIKEEPSSKSVQDIALSSIDKKSKNADVWKAAAGENDLPEDSICEPGEVNMSIDPSLSTLATFAPARTVS